MSRRQADARGDLVVVGSPLGKIAAASIAFGLGFLAAPIYLAIALVSIGICIGGAFV